MSSDANAAERVVKVPNALTIGRLLLAFVVCALVSLHSFHAAFWVFVNAALTDALDGYIARALHQTSALGRQLDPLVDKVLVIVVMVHLTAVAPSPALVWVLTIIVTRELVVQALRSLVEGKGIAFGARWSGKVKTLLQCVAVATALAVAARWPISGLTAMSEVILWAAGLLTAYSGVEYLHAAWNLFRTSGER